MTELIAVRKIKGRIGRMKKELDSAYKGLCRGCCKTDGETFFADNYHTVFVAVGFLSGYDNKARISSGCELARAVLDMCENGWPKEEDIIKMISAHPKVCPEDIENLSFSMMLILVERIHSALKTGKDMMTDISLLARIGGINTEGINAAANPVCRSLFRDPGYAESSRETKKLYRTKLYTLASERAIEPDVFAEELIQRSRENELCELLGLRRLENDKNGKLFCYSALTAVFSLTLSVFGGIVSGSILGGVILFLPALVTARSVLNSVFLRFSKHKPLLSLDPDCKTVGKTRCAVVLSAAVGSVEAADSLYDRLYKIYASNPQDNILITAICDLPAEQVPITSDDTAVIESLDEVINRLDKLHPGKFSCIIRRRSYSKTQDEYMGKERKRGAIMELCRYMAQAGKEDFYAMLGNFGALKGIEYICAVDYDTEPYMDSVSELLCIILHPANRPEIEKGRVIKGSGIIVPRMVTRLEESLSSGFARGMGGIGSVSGYDRESLDFWQDVFGRGSFCGKGLISVEALLRCTAGLPEERVLSHDIPEGELLAAGYAGNTIFTEGFPKGAISYYKRMDRWIRGDIQNLILIFSSLLDPLAKLKLADNILRALTPAAVLLALLSGFVLYPAQASAVAAFALFLYLFPQILGILRTVLSQGIMTRHFFSELLSQTSASLIRLLYEIVMLPTTAVKSLKAVLTACFRMISGKKLLEWTTSAAADRLVYDPTVFFFVPEAISLALLFSPSHLIRLFALPSVAMPFVLMMGSHISRSHEDAGRLSYRDTRELSRDIANMWRFYDDYVTEAESYLPPDNVQFAPVYRICHRTSPTNIGLYLVSVLAACDRRLISIHSMASRISHTIDSIERMEKYKGNLYNWYETKNLRLCPNPYVSSVDSGNFVCCLVALKEGLKEYASRCESLGKVIERIERIVSETDLSAFYDDVKGLMAIGINSATGDKDGSHYDFLMSEARLTSFYAIASRQVPKSHWLRLGRTYLSNGFYSGCASYSGTMFEFFMPELFLKSPESSIFSESLKYALFCQRSYADRLRRPYGISESGYYAFDSMLSYRYMAHGVPKTGLRRGLWADYVVSPYSTYLSLGYDKTHGMENLKGLRKYGLYSRYGFYEALDFTSPDSAGQPEAVKSYMAHHVGMSIIASVNVLQDGIFQKRFMADERVFGARELLCERVRLERNVYEDIMLKPKPAYEKPLPEDAESFGEISPFVPRTKLLKNGEYTVVLTDGGLSTAIYRGKNVYTRTRDCVMRPKGAFFGISDGETACSITAMPDYSDGGACEFGDSYVSYYKNTKKLKTGMRVTLHRNLPCEIRSIAIENTSSEAVSASLYTYIEPSLSPDGAEEAHPAYNRMFVRPEFDPEMGVVTVSRSDSEENDEVFMAIGFAEDVMGSVSFDREEVLTRPEGVAGLFKRGEDIQKSLISEPDPCVFIRTSLEIPPNSQTQLNLFILCADSMDELSNSVSVLKKRFSRQEFILPMAGAGARLADRLLSDILYRPDMGVERADAVLENDLPLNALWEISVSTDIPLILLKLDSTGIEKLRPCLSAYKLLTLSGIKVQLGVLFDDGGRYQREHYTLLVAAAKELNLDGLIYSGGGIIPIDRLSVRPELIRLLKAYACRIMEEDRIWEYASAGNSMPIAMKKTLPMKQRVEQPVALGGFTGNSYVINENPRLPWCHILSSRQFGTLLSDISLGFTYAFNSRENRLTPWDNDTSRDNMGERLILKLGDEYIDVINGSAAVFSPYKAEYFFKERDFEGSVTVGISERGMSKKISVAIKTEEMISLAYILEPCLGFNRRNSTMIIPKKKENSLVLTSCASPLKGYMALNASQNVTFVTSRQDILSGNWKESIAVCDDMAVAAVVVSDGNLNVDFYLSYALDEEAAVDMPGYFDEQLTTKEVSADIECDAPDFAPLVKEWLRYQALHGRIRARTGFYQCSGAYGFRDQLQDAASIILENPSVCKAQILRCCMAQFEEGDVLHWWHTLPGKKPKGIRTKISDDNLWLPYAVCEYVNKTADRSILELNVRYCKGIEIEPGEKERYGEVYYTCLRETVYDHCKRAVNYRAGKTGRNGLMLIGTGDWNDGFNKLGEQGEGESVWLTEFYILVLKRFGELCKSIEPEYSKSIFEYAEELEKSIVLSGRGEKWYLRAYADDGCPIGSEACEVCKIDSIAQSFAQFAGLEDKEFTKSALSEAYTRLADVKRGVVKLFAPAIDKKFRPKFGYIQHYPEGLRENGGQYTHGAVWLGMACLDAGLKKEGTEILYAINPIIRSKNDGYKKYKTEPYYLAGDVYSNKNCYSRGGWSIYTGSAGWYYRALTENSRKIWGADVNGEG